MIEENGGQSVVDNHNGQYSFTSKKKKKTLKIQNFTEARSIIANGTFHFSNSITGFRSVDVNVPTRNYNTIVKNISKNGVYNDSSDDVDGYHKVIVDVESVKNANAISNNTITSNDIYTIPP